MKSEDNSAKPVKAADDAPVKNKCNHGPNQRCIHCIYGDEREVKHVSFDKHVLEQRKKCAKKHAAHQKCQNCTFSQ